MAVPNQDDTQLNCLIKGESNIFVVPVGRNNVVSNLKELIRKARIDDTLKGVGPHTLELWKVSTIDESLCEMTLLFSAQGFHPHRRQTTQDSH